MTLTSFVGLLTLTACASDVITIAPRPPAHYEKIGKASGEGCGVLLFYSSIYSMFPIMLNSRLERAYARALAKQPGATGLINAEVEGSWFWWILGTTYCTSVSGDAIREIAAPPEPAPEPAAPPAPPAPETTP